MVERNKSFQIAANVIMILLSAMCIVPFIPVSYTHLMLQKGLQKFVRKSGSVILNTDI